MVLLAVMAVLSSGIMLRKNSLNDGGLLYFLGIVEALKKRDKTIYDRYFRLGLKLLIALN